MLRTKTANFLILKYYFQAISNCPIFAKTNFIMTSKDRMSIVLFLTFYLLSFFTAYSPECFPHMVPAAARFQGFNMGFVDLLGVRCYLHRALSGTLEFRIR